MSVPLPPQIPGATFRFTVDPARPALTSLSWDTEDATRPRLNLLRAHTAVSLRCQRAGFWFAADTLPTRVSELSPTTVTYHLALDAMSELTWRIHCDLAADQLTMSFIVRGAPTAAGQIEALALDFPFDPKIAATTVLPAAWDESGQLHLPAIISAPDFGQILCTATPRPQLTGRLLGSRAQHTVDLVLDLPELRDGESLTLTFAPVRLPPPAGLQDDSLWHDARRGWFNALQPSAQWGDQQQRYSAPAGILANNVVSDPVSCLVHLWADHILLTPPCAPGIALPDLVRRTVDWWLDHRTKPTGEVIAYWDYADMLDANASPLIAAWDYVEATGDRAWLTHRIARLEFIAEYLISRDLDNDGLVESTQSGNYGTLHEPMRAGSAYDTINAGHKDAYCNALIYRAYRSLADLENQLNRPAQQRRYAACADRLQAAYAPRFFNPATGWLAWWQSADGELHDLAAPLITSLAVCYGLVGATQGRAMLAQLWRKLESTGFARFDLGVPLTLIPVRRGDYIIGHDSVTSPKLEDGSDTFGHYLNGGCCVSDAVHFITALHLVGESVRGDQILHAMVARQARGVFANGGGFQNGVINVYPQGAEFYTWDGRTCGYEGHLTYSYSFLQAVLLREPAFRARLFRPLVASS